jgi:DAACS family dicarboxylate/amino acid:cation (Na+ or H+) symporter
MRLPPLYLQIVIALVLGAGLGLALNAPQYADFLNELAIFPGLVLKALNALAPPLILVAVLHAFLTAEIPPKSGRKLLVLLLTNTCVAIVIGLGVANVVQPGRWIPIQLSDAPVPTTTRSFDPIGVIQDTIPTTILQPLVENKVLQVVVLALTFGIALRVVKSRQLAEGRTDYLVVENLIGTLLEALTQVLSWVVMVVPLAVFGVIAKTIGLKGLAPFQALGFFVLAVILALLFQAGYYLIRVRLQSWVKPLDFLTGGRDAFSTAFSTASSTVTMPITFKSLTDKIGLRESSASLGALVGSNFNNDGTALYEAMSALFIAQVLGLDLTIPQQIIVVLTSIVASVGAAGIPEAGLVTMTLVFTAVGLPTQYIVFLLTVDWFLDRCRTTINVMGDMTVATLLDGKEPECKKPL